MSFMVQKSTTVSDGAVTTAKINDDAVTLAKMAAGTDGNIITYDASGNPAVAVTGSSGQILTSGGAGVAPTFASVTGGTWVLLETLSPSGAATATFSAAAMFDGTYDRVMINIDGWRTSVDDRELYMTVSDDSGTSYESADYDYHLGQLLSSSASYAAVASSSAAVMMLNTTHGSASDESCTYQIQMSQPDHTAHGKVFHIHGAGITAAGVPVYFTGAATWQGGVTAIDRLRFSQESGNITATMRAYGVKDS